MRNRLFPRFYSCKYDSSPVRDWLKEFEAWLKNSGYTLEPMRGHLCVVRSVLEKRAPLDRGTQFSASDLVEMFQPYRQNHFHRGTEGVFAKFLRASGRWIEAPPTGHCVEVLQAYRTHCKEMRGLSDCYVDRLVHFINEFLDLTITADHSLQDIDLDDIDRHVAYLAPYLQRGTLIYRIACLRCFFRFCHDRGLTQISPDQIDSSRKYRYEKPPRAIAWEMTQQLLSSIDRSTPMGERDYTILFLIAHYGLRPGEITALTIDSIDWKHHTLRVVQSKTHSTLVLPMAPVVERVLKRYLRRGRPTTERSELFLTVLAPIGPIYTNSINSIFRRQAEKSGLPLSTASPYGLRHGFAMRLLEQGVGMKAIGDLLGHSDLESTSVYLRLQTEALRNVALPLPAGTQPARSPS